MDDKIIVKKLVSLNVSLSEINKNDLAIDSNKSSVTISSELASMQSKLNDVIKNKNVDEKDIVQVADEMSKEVEIEMEELNAWKNQQIEKLSSIADRIVAKVADLLPSVPTIPDVAQQALAKIEATKSEVDEKILNAQIRIGIKHNQKLTDLIKKSK